MAKKRDIEKMLRKYGWWPDGGAKRDHWTNGCKRRLYLDIKKLMKIQHVESCKWQRLILAKMQKIKNKGDRMYIAFDGKVTKSNGWYAIEIPALLVFSQRKRLKEALGLASDALEELLESYGITSYEPKTIKWTNRKAHCFRVYLPLNQPAIAFILRQLRGYKEMSLADVAKKMNLKSKNSVAAYEKKLAKVGVNQPWEN